MGTRPIKRENSPCRNLVNVMAHKTKHSRRTQRQGFFRWVKDIAVALYWSASFVLIILEIWNVLRSW